MSTAYIVVNVRNWNHTVSGISAVFNNAEAAQEYANTAQELIRNEIEKYSSTYEVLPFVMHSKVEDLNK